MSTLFTYIDIIFRHYLAANAKQNCVESVLTVFMISTAVILEKK